MKPTWHIKWGVYICRISVYARYKYTYIVVNACWILIAMETRLCHVVHLKPNISWVVFEIRSLSRYNVWIASNQLIMFLYKYFHDYAEYFYVASAIVLACYVYKYFMKHADDVYGLIRLSFYKRKIWNIICVCLFTKAT